MVKVLSDVDIKSEIKFAYLPVELGSGEKVWLKKYVKTTITFPNGSFVSFNKDIDEDKKHHGYYKAHGR